jgi:hypothetical protein
MKTSQCIVCGIKRPSIFPNGWCFVMHPTINGHLCKKCYDEYNEIHRKSYFALDKRLKIFARRLTNPKT